MSGNTCIKYILIVYKSKEEEGKKLNYLIF